MGLAGAAATSGASAAATIGSVVASGAASQVLDEPATITSEDDWLSKTNRLGIKNSIFGDLEELVEAYERRGRAWRDFTLPPKYRTKKSWSEAYKWGEYQKDIDRVAELQRAIHRNKAFAERLIAELGIGE